MSTSQDSVSDPKTQNNEDQGEFRKVKTRSRKRKIQEESSDQTESMETTVSQPKRPNFPAISGDKLTVCTIYNYSALV